MRSNRSPKVNGNFTERIEFMVREKVGQAFVHRTVQNKAMRPLLVVMSGKKQYRLTEIRIA